MRFCPAPITDLQRRLVRSASPCALLAASLAWLCCGCTAIPNLSHKAVMTPHEKAGIGAVAVTELLGTSQLSQDREQAAVTLRIGRQLADASGRADLDWDFKVVQHPRPIAVALPNATVLVTDSLLARCRTEADLAAALAKEMGCMLAGVYPREVLAPNTEQAYAPLDIGQITPADESAKKWEDIQAADSIGLSLLARAGYDPIAADEFWPASSAPAGTDYLAATRRLRTAAHQQSFNKSLGQARRVYASHPAKIGAGGALAFTAVPPSHPVASMGSQPAKPAMSTFNPMASSRLNAPSASQAASSGNLAMFSSDGDFQPPNLASDHGENPQWSSTPEASDSTNPSPFEAPSDIQQTSFEQLAAPAADGPLLP